MFWPVQNIVHDEGQTLPKKTPNAAEAVLDAETTLRDQLQHEALFPKLAGSFPAQPAPSHTFVDDPVAVTVAVVAVG